MAVYGYTRVSTQSQSDDGLSLDAQERQLQGYAMMNNFDIEQVFVERAVSGWKPLLNRPEGGRLSAVLKQGDIRAMSEAGSHVQKRQGHSGGV